ncbi:MAG: cell division protein ZapE, partial [Fimbriimonadaceae bacterium]|nr:cell division protein ZapE [Alphaproteobacteria bacterium]
MNADTSNIVERYDTMVRIGEIESDPAQKRVAAHLSRLGEELENRRMARKSSALGWLFARRERENPLKGLYIHGGVGRGKTMLMDLFYKTLKSDAKRRVHFHEFMSDVHDRIYEWRQKSKRGEVKG